MRIAAIALIGMLLLLPSGPEAAPPAGGIVNGQVLVVGNNGKTIANPCNVWVYLKQVSRRKPTPPPDQQIVQETEVFKPHVLVVPVGTKVRFPNRDKTEHNVFSSTVPIFDLGRYTQGAGKVQSFLDVGEYDIYCDIHKNMSAKVKVVDSERGWIRAVKSDGTFSIADVPAGTYKVIAWTPDSDEKSAPEPITVVDQQTKALQYPIHLRIGNPKPHKRKDGSDYPLYNSGPAQSGCAKP